MGVLEGEMFGEGQVRLKMLQKMELSPLDALVPIGAGKERALEATALRRLDSLNLQRSFVVLEEILCVDK